MRRHCEIRVERPRLCRNCLYPRLVEVEPGDGDTRSREATQRLRADVAEAPDAGAGAAFDELDAVARRVERLSGPHH